MSKDEMLKNHELLTVSIMHSGEHCIQTISEIL